VYGLGRHVFARNQFAAIGLGFGPDPARAAVTGLPVTVRLSESLGAMFRELLFLRLFRRRDEFTFKDEVSVQRR
jgi:hypothetical protein